MADNISPLRQYYSLQFTAHVDYVNSKSQNHVANAPLIMITAHAVLSIDYEYANTRR